MKTSRVAVHTAAAIAVAALLAGCSLFEAEKAPAAGAPVAAEEPAGLPAGQSDVSDAQRQSDIDSCREQARAVVRQEQNITDDIRSSDAQDSFRNESSDLSRNMDEYEARQRYHRILEECLKNRGYGAEEPAAQ